MKARTISEILMTILFIICLPLLIAEILLKKPGHLIKQVKLSFQLMLFIIGWSHSNNQK